LKRSRRAQTCAATGKDCRFPLKSRAHQTGNGMADSEKRTDQKNEIDAAPSAVAAFLASPLLWGGLLTVGFYELIPHLPVYRELAERYFCGHPLEYALAGMFFVGMSMLGVKLFKLHSERASLESCEIEAGDEPAEEKIRQAAIQMPRFTRQSQLAARLRDVLDYLKHRKSAAGLEEHLKYLDQLSADRLHDSYSLLQTITWAVPIVGFLGTVMGITLAIANIDPEVLDNSLETVTGGLAVAFDTTALALSLSVVLVFSYFFVKRAESRILSQVEDFSLRQLLPLFPADVPAGSPLLEAQSQAAEHLISRTAELISAQTELWSSSIEGIRERWSGTLDTRQRELSAALRTGTEDTLTDHSRQLAGFRQEFVSAYQQATASLNEQLAQSQQQRREADAQLLERLAKVEDSRLTRFEKVQADSHQRNQEIFTETRSEIQQWQRQLAANTAAMTAQQQALTEQTKLLSQLMEQGTDLKSLQGQLSENLDALRAAETFEQTMHSLSAAVHLLTAHARPAARAA
jgi:biopolymer transport protein ExbB/TolQ